MTPRDAATALSRCEAEGCLDDIAAPTVDRPQLGRSPSKPLLTARGTEFSTPFPSSEESCKPSVPQQRNSRSRPNPSRQLGKTNLDQFATGLVGARSPYGSLRSNNHGDGPLRCNSKPSVPQERHRLLTAPIELRSSRLAPRPEGLPHAGRELSYWLLAEAPLPWAQV